MKNENNLNPPLNSVRSNPFLVILRIGLIAGTLDISDALIFTYFRGGTPKGVFQFIASGLIGMKSFQDGTASVVLGVFLHFLIALIWTAIFYLAARKLEILVRRPVVSGLLYGGLVYLCMNWIVLPLSRIPHSTRPVALISRINGVLALLFFIGLTVSLLVRKSLNENVVTAKTAT
jgi:hypothetical protein